MENKFRALVEAGADAIWMVGESGIIEYASPASRAVLGYSPEELTGANAFDFFLPSDRETARERLFGPEGGAATFRLRRKDGKTIFADVSGANRLSDPAVAAVIVSLRDVTEARRAEQALRDSESRFRALVENSDDGFALLDRNGMVVYCGPPILGYTTFVGRSVLEAIHPDDLERMCADLAIVASRPDKPFHAEYRARHADGRIRWVEVLYTNLLTDAAVGGVVLNYRDVTESRQREDELRRTRDQLTHILESIREVFLAVDRDWRFTFVNGRVADALGRPAEEIVGQNLWELFPDARQTEFYPQYRRVMAERIPVQFELRYPRSGRWLDVHAYPTEEGLSAYVLDITDRKRAERSCGVQLEVVRALVECADRATLAPRILQVLGDGLTCSAVTLWTGPADRLRPSETWRAPKSKRVKPADTLARQALETGGIASDGPSAAIPIGSHVLELTISDPRDLDDDLRKLLDTLAALLSNRLS